MMAVRRGLRAATLASVCLTVAMTWVAPAEATFPGVNGSIAYQGFRVGFSVESATPDGALQRVVASSGAHPAWSPSGAQIAFSEQGRLYTMDAVGAGKHEIPGLADAWFATWSQDGRRLATGNFTGNYDIWLIGADGSDPRQLTDSPAEDIAPSWSPDGSRLAFETNRDGDGEIYVINADGTGLHDLTNAHASDESGPDWSPDGRRIVFARTGSEICVINADGSGLVEISSGAAATWSPDGHRIAFTRNGAGGTDLYTMKPDGADVVRVTRDGGEKFFPAWQPLVSRVIS